MSDVANIPLLFQKHLKEAIHRYKTTLIVQARRIGVTHTVFDSFLEKMMSLENYSCLIVCSSQNSLNNSFQKISKIVSKNYLDIQIDYPSKTFYLNNSSMKLCSRSYSFGLRVLHEMDDIYIEDIHFCSGISDCFKASSTLLKTAESKIIFSTTMGFLYWNWITSCNDKLFIARLLTQSNFEKIIYFDKKLNITFVDIEKMLDFSGIRPFLIESYDDTSWMLIPKENSHCIFMCRDDKHRPLLDFGSQQLYNEVNLTV